MPTLFSPAATPRSSLVAPPLAESLTAHCLSPFAAVLRELRMVAVNVEPKKGGLLMKELSSAAPFQAREAGAPSNEITPTPTLHSSSV